jgi:mono/diheme cytochrome c family protein
MLSETPAQLVAHLSHPNGWWRDSAQRLLVLKQDKSVVPALQSLVRTQSNLLGRFHAMWTLEGLGALDAGLVREQIKDSNPRMRVQGLRASESLYKQGDRSFTDDYRVATKDSDPDVALQAILTINVLKVADAPAIIQATMDANSSRGVQEIGKALLAPPTGRGGRGTAGLAPAMQDLMQRGATSYAETCFACHGSDGRGAPMAGAPPGTLMAPPIAGSPRVQGHRDYVIKVLLHGLTGPIADKTYTQVMLPMGAQKDDWIAAVASHVRNDFGNSGTFVLPADVARVRAATAGRKLPWTVAELEASLPTLLQPDPAWKVTASHNQAAAADALTIVGWASGTPQEAGMWVQVELPQALRLTEVQFNTPAGRGFGPPPAAAPGPGMRGGGAAGTPNAPAAGQAPQAGAGAAVPTPPAGAGAGQPAIAAAAGAGAARDYQVQVSMDGKKWTPVANGPISSLTVAAFAPVSAKFVRVTQTAAPQGQARLVIQNLRLFKAAAAPGR